MNDRDDAAPWARGERIARLLADVQITSPMAFRFGSGPQISAGDVVPTAAGAGLTPGVAALRDALATALYAAAYMRDYRGPGYDPASMRRTVVADPAFLERLDARNPSRAAWEPGWRVFSRDLDGSVHASKGDRAMRLPPGRYAAVGTPRSPAVGDSVERWRDRSSLTHQAGYYYAFGEAPPSDYDLARIGRLYFDGDAESAAWLLGELAPLLNRFGIPFWFKCPVDPAAFDRLDASVLYVARRHVPSLIGLLAPLASDFSRRLRGGVPLWTVPLFAGVGGADDPGTGESFGQSRCALFAAGLVDAWARGHQDPASRAGAVAARFRAAGLAAAQPHLALGLVDVYPALTSSAVRETAA